MIRQLLCLAVVYAMVGPAGAVVLDTYDAAINERFSTGTTPNATFLIDEALIRGIGVNSRAALITPQHAITAVHSGIPTIQFRRADGVVQTYASSSSTILQTTLGDGTMVNSDIRLLRLDAPVPVSHGINSFAVIDSPLGNYFGQELIVMGQNNQAGKNVINQLGLGSFEDGSGTSVLIGYSFDTVANGGTGGLGGVEAGLIGGDSGHAALMDVGGTTALVGAHFGIDVPPGSSAGAGDQYDSFSTLLTPYLDDIEAITMVDGFALNRVSITAVPEPSMMAVMMIGTLFGFRRMKGGGSGNRTCSSHKRASQGTSHNRNQKDRNQKGGACQV